MDTESLPGHEAANPDVIAEHIARSIERDIIFGRLRAGQKLGEEDLAERFAASRHQVREGLARLERLEIVVRERNRGASVRGFSAREILEIYELREMLQRHAALRIRLPADSAAIDTLKTTQADHEAAVRAGDVEQIHAANDLFHLQLFRLGGNDRLAELIKHYMDLTYVVRAHSFSDPQYLERARRDHRLMIKLLGSQDPWALAELCVEHIERSKTLYLANLAVQAEAP